MSTPEEVAAQRGPTEAELKLMIKLRKAEKDSYKVMNQAAPQLAALFNIMEGLSPVIEPIANFFSIFSGAMQAGLGESAEKLANALFTDANVELISKLGEISADFIEVGLIPLLDIFGLLAPALEILLPGMNSTVTVLGDLTKGIQLLISWIGTDDTEGVQKALADFSNSIEKFINDLGEDVVGIENIGTNIRSLLTDFQNWQDGWQTDIATGWEGFWNEDGQLGRGIRDFFEWFGTMWVDIWEDFFEITEDLLNTLTGGLTGGLKENLENFFGL